MDNLTLDKKTFRKFGITMAIAFAVIALILIIRHKPNTLLLLLLSVLWFISASTMPQLLKPLYIIWMKFAFVLNWINTRIVLFLIFYLIFTPMGLLMRLFGADLLNKKIDKDSNSYWQEAVRKAFSHSDYEKQF